MEITNQKEYWEGFGQSSAEDVQNLLKALQAQEGITDVANLIGVGALQPQSLEGTLALLTFQEKHLALWRDIPKGMAESTLEEYSVQLGYGQDSSGWVQQMESALESDAELAREYAIMKYQRQMWKFSDVAGIVKTISPVERVQKQAAALRCLRNMNRTLYSGDSNMISESIDGFEKTILNNGSSDHVIDLRGASPAQKNFREAAELITANFGNVEGAGLYMSPGALTTISQIIETNQRYAQNQLGADGNLSLGHRINVIHTDFGSITPKVDIFLAGEYDGRTVPKIASPSNPKVLVEGATSERAPGMPSIAVTAQGATVSGSLWSDTGTRPSAKTYNFRVAAGNRFGLSKACASANAGENVVANGSLTITITPSGASNYPATYYEIYSEQVAGSGVFRFLARVKDSGAGTTSYVDLNKYIPGTSRMFLLDLTSLGDLRTFMLKRLAPMHSKEYARIGEFRWGSVNLYATPQYYAPLRFVLFINVPVGVQSKSSRIDL